jgi:hypothetical protein
VLSEFNLYRYKLAQAINNERQRRVGVGLFAS